MDESIEEAKRVKHLENQNRKLKRLLQTAVDISNQDLVSTDRLRIENNDLTKTMNNLEEEKRRLEKQLSDILDKNESALVRALRKLEEEHTELQAEMRTVLSGFNENQTEVTKLETEDLELRSALLKLEQEKCKLIERLRKVEKKRISQPNPSTHEVDQNQGNNKAQIEVEPSTNNEDDNIVSTFLQLEKTYKEYIDILEEHNLENKISDLITKTEKLATEVHNSNSDIKQTRKRLNETILNSNTNILNKIKDVKSKLATSIEKNSTVLNTDESKLISMRISEMEKEKEIIYDELEDYLQSSPGDISKLTENVDDPEIKRLVHEVELQKAVLMYNLKMLKLKEESAAITSRSATEDMEITAPPSSPASMLPSNSEEIKELYANDSEACGKSSSLEGSGLDEQASGLDEHHRLEETVTRLENERKLLLQQLQSVSGTSPLRFEERQLQTQSELHSSFMREESSQEIVINKNFDDATNQLYRSEDIRLEQRIRELEIENNKIKREVQRLIESVHHHHLPAQVLRERIEELERKTRSQPEIE